MGFEDLFKKRMRKHHGGYNPSGDYLRGHYDDRGGIAHYLHLLDRVKNYRKLLLAGCAITAIIVLILGAAAILAVVLMADSISKYISSNEIKGFVESARDLLMFPWNGSGK